MDLETLRVWWTWHGSRPLARIYSHLSTSSSRDRETNARIFPHTRWAGRWEWRVLRLAFTVLSSLGIAQIAQPYLRALSTKCGETTKMTVGDGAEVVYVARNRTQQIISASAEGTPDADVFDVSATR